MTTLSSTAPSRPRRASHSLAPSPSASPAPRPPTSRVSHRPTPSQAAAARRASIIAAPADSKDALAASLKQETEQKEQLLIQVQNKDNTISDLTKENASLLSTLNAAETSLNDLYAEQARMEDEMAARIDVSDKLRAQLRELEKEKRDLQRRYNEQTSTFEAERQAFYDNEQHLKSRIQSLTQSRKQAERSRTPEPSEPDTEHDQVDQESIKQPDSTEQDINDPEHEPAEMTSLKLELSTLSTSYASLQNTLVLLQTQLVDVKRVNNELQEDNESYMILLREKTLSGQFNVLKQVGGATSTTDGEYDDDMDEAELDDREDVDSTGSHGTGRSRTLDRVDEEAGEDASVHEIDPDAEPLSPGSGSRRSAGRRLRGSASPDSVPRGESLAGLPITGPGLDLAAELGRAESNNPMSSEIEESDRSLGRKNKRGKKGSAESRKVSNPDGAEFHDMETLRSEVKSLKDANKALSLYASKIIDRIIAQEGFEHVLSVDYEPSEPKSETTLLPSTKESAAKKPRPQTTMFSLGSSKPFPKVATPETPSSPQPVLSATNSPDPSRPSRTKRRSLSIDWKSFSLFGGSEKKDAATLRPLTLKPGTTPMMGARKLDTQEDEEDRRERERLNATMKLMGIEKPLVSPAVSNSASGSPIVAPPLEKTSSSPGPQTSATAAQSRFSLFRSKSAAASDGSAANSGRSFGLGIGGNNAQNDLTQEALEHAEAQNSLAVLDARERTLSEVLSKGGSGGFTEITRRSLGDERRSRRSRRTGDGSGSGSTVWSAGMSRHEEDDDS
ncbi:hypothetical protein CONPUDRAFT_115123 [Coniophora puteana RWD-64-598 SS2]|uniref:Uncharacterized protein n=1 Tax=Coniophora puteana (strain RWD-64-598) TaxID=741705 RepID=A0A5M3N6Y3_CONPW|nr:uncharacterized protein CONPUDRAFT_115123 [Coniophora puteana RWD-64-598 SS2]EIW86611.1 hypothetical protein CONPUDRAFT_115123 [Coniophora puteana RWD-64-598 SS2]